MTAKLAKKYETNLALLYSLQCYLLPGKARLCKTSFTDIYNASYQLWKDMILQAYQEQGLQDKIAKFTSDEFVRQQEFVSLFHGKEPVGLFMFDWSDLTFESMRNHSYFRHYPDSIIQSLCQKASHYMIMGNLVVNPKWRQTEIGLGISDILGSMATAKRFHESAAEALITFTRNNRKTNELSYRHGGAPLLMGHIANGGNSDIIIFYRNTACMSPLPGIATAVDLLWKNKIVAIKATHEDFIYNANSNLIK